MKHKLISLYSNQGCIEEKNPLKQGLKLSGLNIVLLHFIIEEKNPLKQGLKPPETKTKIAKNRKLKRRIH